MFEKQMKEIDVPYAGKGCEEGEKAKKRQLVDALRQQGWQVEKVTNWHDDDTDIHYDHYILTHDGSLTE